MLMMQESDHQIYTLNELLIKLELKELEELLTLEHSEAQDKDIDVSILVYIRLQLKSRALCRKWKNNLRIS